MVRLLILSTMVGLFASAISAVQFSESPWLWQQNDTLHIHFVVSEPTDVEVAVLDSSGKIIRHLAAGLLGGAKAPPAPLAPGLSQGLTWDFNDDNGLRAQNPPFKVRVRRGIKPVYNFSINTLQIPSGTGQQYLGVAYTPTLDFITPDHPILGMIYDKAKGGHAPPKLDIAMNRRYGELYIKATGGAATLERYTLNNGTRLGSFTLSGAAALSRNQWGEPCFSWDGNLMYYLTADQEVGRYSRLGVPNNFPGKSTFRVDSVPQGFQHSRGVSTGPDGSIYVLHHNTFREWDQGRVTKIDTNGNIVKRAFIKIPAAPGGGIRVDRNHNIFLGARVKFGAQYPADLVGKFNDAGTQYTTSSWWAVEMYGSLLKFDSTGRNQWVYLGLSQTQTHVNETGAYCVCRVTRFDIDGWGRIIFPDAFQMSLRMVDNNGNFIRKIKNSDITGNYMSYPEQVQAVDDALFVSDYTNHQILRLDLSSEESVELNATGVAIESQAGTVLLPSLTCTPNPCNASASIRFRLPDGLKGDVTLQVYDVNHRLVRTLIHEPGVRGLRTATWNGKDRGGRIVASGTYLLSLTAAGKSFNRLLVVVR